MSRGFKAAIMASLLVGICVFCLFDCQRWSKTWKHAKSGVVGLNRTVTMYDCQGKPIRQWTGRFMVETTGGVVSFIDDAGKEVKVLPLVSVEEK